LKQPPIPDYRLAAGDFSGSFPIFPIKHLVKTPQPGYTGRWITRLILECSLPVFFKILNRISNHFLTYIGVKINQQFKLIILLAGILLLFLLHQDVLYDSDQIAYLSGAKNLLENGTYLVNGKPDWRGVGYGHFLAIPFFFFGANFQTGVWLSIFCALATLIAVYRISKFLFHGDKPLLVVLVLFPAFHFWRQSTTLMTEIPALCFLAWGFYFLLEFYERDKRRDFYLACVFFGVAVLFRPVNIFVATLFLPFIFQKKYWGDLILGAFIAGIILSPQFIYNATHFGGPFVSGYSQIFKPFDLSYFFSADATLRRPTFQMVHYLRGLFLKPGGLIFWLPFLITAAAGLKKVSSNRLLKLLATWFGSYLLLISFYAYHDERFFVPLLPPLAIFIVFGFEHITKWLEGRNTKRLRFLRTNPLVLFALAWIPGVLLSWTLIQTSVALHANRFAALNQVKTLAPVNAGLITSESYLGRYLTGLETVNYSKTWNQQASFSAISEFIQSKDTVFVVLPEKRLYIVTQMNGTSDYTDIKNWLDHNFTLQPVAVYTSQLPWLFRWEKLTQFVQWAVPSWPQEQFYIWQIKSHSQNLADPVNVGTVRKLDKQANFTRGIE